MGGLLDRIQKVLNRIPKDFGGGCSVEKAFLMAWLICRYNLTTTVDIGVYRGRSLFPQALAHALHTKGMVYGIDPWNQKEAREYDTVHHERINEFIDKLDFDSIYSEVETLGRDPAYHEHCTLIRRTSEEAIQHFERRGIFFDLVHIDGNHDTMIVLRDIELYASRLRNHGFLVMDDISWESVKPALKILSASLKQVYHRTDKKNDYAIFWKGKSSVQAMLLAAKLRTRDRGFMKGSKLNATLRCFILQRFKKNC